MKVSNKYVDYDQFNNTNIHSTTFANSAKEQHRRVVIFCPQDMIPSCGLHRYIDKWSNQDRHTYAIRAPRTRICSLVRVRNHLCQFRLMYDPEMRETGNFLSILSKASQSDTFKGQNTHVYVRAITYITYALTFWRRI